MQSGRQRAKQETLAEIMALLECMLTGVAMEVPEIVLVAEEDL